MTIDQLKEIAHHCVQSEAAAFAVLAAHVRENAESQMQTGIESADQPIHDMIQVLETLEEVMLASIKTNDGNVVHWIGIAAKQMNPLLS